VAPKANSQLHLKTDAPKDKMPWRDKYFGRTYREIAGIINSFAGKIPVEVYYMSKREAFSKRFGPGVLPGILLGDWLRLLATNRFAVSPPFWLRACSIGYCSLVNSVFAIFERLRYGSRLANVKVESPVFILGHWRQGTTHLHNLLATDDQFYGPTLYQVCYPHTFLTTESTWVSKAIANHLPATRPMDNMALGVEVPFEDEYAICASGRYSPYLSFAFPRRRTHYDRYLTLHEVSKGEIEAWKQQLGRFLRKVIFKSGRKLILKSPTHTGRVKTLLGMFPNAKFIHIHRNPFDVFLSTRHQVNVALDWYELQAGNREWVDDWIIDRFRRIYDSFFDERGLIPEGNYCEVEFEQLEREPIAEVRRIYTTLGFPDSDAAADKLRAYVDSLEGYRKNSFPPLSNALRERIIREWGFAFSDWGYAIASETKGEIKA